MNTKLAKIDPLALRPTVMDVDLDALEHNFKAISGLTPAEVMPVVKANAYGHGIVESTRVLERAGARLFGVALLEEGIELREAGIKAPILVFGGISGAQVKYFIDYDLQITASSVGKLKNIDEVARETGKRAQVHLKIDTGLGRIGVQWHSATDLLKAATEVTHTDVVGIYSHFANADQIDLAFTHTQIERFESVIEFYRQANLPLPKLHLANSAAILRVPEAHYDYVRPGIMLYGVLPNNCSSFSGLELKPVMSIRSKVVFFKVLRAGCGVSYGHTWTSAHDTRIVTVPIGYGDGYLRRLSNQGKVLINGKRYPVVGAICMDQLMVNIGGEDEAFNGDEVVLLGQQSGRYGTGQITISDIAQAADARMHEVLTATNMRVPRRYHYHGKTFIE
ncbi:alanine racemase [bacterium]|nr:alanine racemase [bacterium]